MCCSARCSRPAARLRAAALSCDGGEGASLEAALIYSNIVFSGSVLLWVMNGLASVIRGTGNMLIPALVICAGAVLLVPLSPLLIFGLGPVPTFGIAGGGIALVLFYVGGTTVLGWYVLSGRDLVRFKLAPLRWPLARDILRVGAVASVTSVQTNVTIALTTALVWPRRGPCRGRGLRHRGAARVPAGAAGVRAWRAAGGAGRHQYRRGKPRARAAYRLVRRGHRLHPHRDDRRRRGDLPARLAHAVRLRSPRCWKPAPHTCARSGPFYGVFGFGLALYFASQGAGRLLWPLAAGFARMVFAVGGGWLVLHTTGSLPAMFIVVGLALAIYGGGIALSVWLGAWFPRRA